MSSDVDLCNAALASLGDDATVASLSPPEGSAQADHCARFYPMARDTLLELHSWGFTTRRAPLALLAEAPPSSWRYAYAAPADTINLLAVLAPDALDDISAGAANYANWGDVYESNAIAYTPQTFTCESNSAGAQIILTNQAGAVLRYTARVTDSSQFSPLFEEALVMLLAARLAGPVIKGSEGRAVAKAMMQEFRMWFAQAAASDANQQRHVAQQSTSWMAGR
ncbi:MULTISPECIES: hypothetical protein [unclassified Janthinobacterium]|uniref:hypothetical protein n=1 Tax=unclassified Janthinobacterium TaxID=2610881 RepID=UPI000345457E|nr:MULTISPECIES: hypothetical protein [unclassified Janthinobacterium]MEC5161720.1 hypothetical protein [Janthinobacterium sp. CG_S6]